MPNKLLSGFRITYRNKINPTVLISIDKKIGNDFRKQIVIIHQYVGADINLKALRHFTYFIQEQIAIFIVGNDIAAIVSAGQYVI